ncbi:hypothetical protein YC2023_119159 [Brassica napus]
MVGEEDEVEEDGDRNSENEKRTKMGSLKKKAINASTKLKHSLKKRFLKARKLDIEKAKQMWVQDFEFESLFTRISFLRKQLDHKRFKELLELHHNKHVGSVCNSCQGSS